MQKKQVTDLKYKDGEKVAHPMHLSNTSWNRDGVKKVKKSRKECVCVFGCEITTGSQYTSLEMLAGSGGCETSCVSFALCEAHTLETEKELNHPLTQIPSQMIWLRYGQLK
ncbi:hypothetical protein [Endozoicomonas sp. ALE010]|uniref:hypothetical protein n=1 Tax=Endozoicomonas sp. ALE010 TaxID=3403081 RepID=UPI003BB49F38